MTAPPAPTRTLLLLDGLGIPLYSARGLTQTLAPIAGAAQIFRSINGALMDFGSSQFQKYTTKISCQDQRVPRMDGVWPGKLNQMHCVIEPCYPSGGTPARAVVPGSLRSEGDYYFYRPILNVMLMQTQAQIEEYPADVSWEKEFEEA